METIEYRVRPVTRYIVTRFTNDPNGVKGGSIEGRGEYENSEVAFEVGYALCKAEHDKLGWPPGDMRIKYPENPALKTAVRIE
jgi:hypothetical protein